MSRPETIVHHHYRPHTWLQVSGSDAGSFLQGQFTNDVSGLGKGGSIYGLWLNQKGKIIADSFIVGASPGEYWIGSYFCPAGTIRRRLEDYIIAADVTVEDATEGWAGVAVLGEGAGDWLASEAAGMGVFFRGRRAAVESWEWIYPASTAEKVAEKLAGRTEVSAEKMERERIAAGLPAIPVDAGPGDLPNEAGLEAAAISYTKGCYLGQEIIARLKSRGQARRRLARIQGTGAPPALPAALWQEGRAVGELRSAAPGESGGRFIGLAMLTLLKLRPDLPLELSDTGAVVTFL